MYKVRLGSAEGATLEPLAIDAYVHCCALAGAPRSALDAFVRGLDAGALGADAPAVAQGDADKVVGSVQEAFGELVNAETMYLYLVDELTGEPVRDKPKEEGGIYPIEIDKASEVVPQLLPLMQVGMRAMSLFNNK